MNTAVTKPAVLVIDEDSKTTRTLATKLRGAGYEVDIIENGDLGLQYAQQTPYEVIILDEVLPETSGIDICSHLRRKGITTPILMISDSFEKVSIIRCLELGADDYLIKPFSHNELIARMRALERRHRKTFSSFWANKYGISLDFANYTARTNNQMVKLTKKEALLLRRLMIESPQPLTREDLLSDVWGIDGAHTSNRLDVYIRRLRWKLEKLTNKQLIHTVRGHGYYFSEKPNTTTSHDV